MYRDIYLDNSATTKPYEEVMDLVREVGLKYYGNPSSLHRKGLEAEKLINEARETIASCLGAELKEIIFTSGGTESNNLAIRGYLSANPRKGRHIITTSIEHPSVLEVFKFLEQNGYKADYIEPDSNGCIDPEQLGGLITEETALISIMMVNNETGAIQPVDEIIKIRDRKNRNTAIHVDGVQAFGKINIDLSKQGIDLLTFSSHKIHGPKGVGGLYISKKIRLKPVLFGGGQETLLRSGTENVPGICGFGLAAKMCHEKISENYNHVKILNERFRSKLSECSFASHVISGINSSPYILNIAFPGLKSEVLLHHLEERGIFISTGSACSSRKAKRSHVLTAMGLENRILDSAVRFSFSADNTEEDIDDTINALREIVPVITVRKKGRLGASDI